jgi:hypothetical protein
LEGEHELTFTVPGYKDVVLTVNETEHINLNMMEIKSDILKSVTPQADIPVYAGNGITVMSSGDNNFVVSKSNIDYSNIGINKLSETIEVTKANENDDKISIFVALQPEKEISDANVYLLHTSNGKYSKIFMSQFGDSISYEILSNKLTYKNIYNQRENFVLAERKAPVLKTDLDYVIVNSKLSIPLSNIAVDPDNIDDLTFQIKSVSNNQYEVNLSDDYLEVIHNNSDNDAAITLSITHDGITNEVSITVRKSDSSSNEVLGSNQDILVLFPNPTNDRVFLRIIDDNLSVEKIHVFDLQGRLTTSLLRPDISNIEISLPTKGIYLVSVFTNKGVVTQRIIKN